MRNKSLKQTTMNEALKEELKMVQQSIGRCTYQLGIYFNILN